MILDTNAISSLSRRDESLLHKIGSMTHLSTTLINIGEYQFGILGSSYKEPLQQWLEALLQHIEILKPDLQTLPHYSKIRYELKNAGTPIPANDIWISAIARQYKLPILSKDKHFDLVSEISRHEW